MTKGYDYFLQQLDSGSDGDSFALSKKSMVEERMDMSFAPSKIVTSATYL